MDDRNDGDPRALERQRALMSPAAKMRRARFAKYVGVAMGASVALCAAAVVKVAFVSGTDETPRAVVAAASTRASPVAAASPPSRPDEAPAREAPSAVAATAPSAPASAASASAVPTAPSAAVGSAASASASAPVEAPQAPSVPPAAKAAKERESSRFALERGDLGGAVAAGERSVALDPTDGEAWLVLGAAYQARGDLVQARRCYRACVEQGTRGPKSECRAMASGP